MSSSTALVSASPFPLAGELASLGAALIWAGSISLYRRFATGIPAATISVYKNVIATLCMLAALPFALGGFQLRWDMLGLLAFSGFVGIAVGDSVFFAALSRLGAQMTAALQCMSPPIAAILAALFFEEKLSARETTGMLITTLGVGCIVWFSRKPSSQLGHLSPRVALEGLGYAFAAAACQGLSIAISRFAFQGSGVITGTLARLLPATLLLLVVFPAVGDAASLGVFRREPKRSLALALGAFSGTFLGLLMMSIGTKYSKAGVAAALSSTYPVWIIPIAHFGLMERVSWPTVLCTLMAVSGVAIMLWV